ncbi:MAG: isoprenylcysteine carboxylmethyltransferase family protein [Anaerolineales bacterium]|nr:isoprenylcysteine carboxylmethyltransferase family protein [Anaerolineales bacterium]
MSNSTNPPMQGTRGQLDSDGIRRIIIVVLQTIIVAGIIFLAAGRLAYVWGWVYLGISLFGLLLNLTVMRSNPEVINERGRGTKGQKDWDKTLTSLLLLVGIVAFPLAGLDVRFGWSSVPLWLHLLSIPFVLFSTWIIFLVMKHNTYLAQGVRIQEERGHQVATGGPYKYIRHPMYLAMSLSWATTPLLLGSWWMYIPSGLCIILFVVRTALEDQTLQAELPGYKAYAQQTRYRLLPGIW